MVGGVEVPLGSHLRFDDSDGRRRTRGGRAQTQPELKASHRNALALGTQTFDTPPLSLWEALLIVDFEMREKEAGNPHKGRIENEAM
jgi:hypothetical protein